MANLSFNAANVSPSVAYAPLPAGDYTAIITESETKATKDGQGQYLQLKLQIQGGEFSGRTLFDRVRRQQFGEWIRHLHCPGRLRLALGSD